MKWRNGEIRGWRIRAIVFASIIPFLVLSVVVSQQFAVRAAWQEPTAVAPGGNIPSPITVGSVPQAKSGNLRLGSLDAANITRTLEVVGASDVEYGLTVGGNLTVGTNSLFVNAGTNRVGIGTIDPADMTAKLTVRSSAPDATAARVVSASDAITAVTGESAGNVGIAVSNASVPAVSASGTPGTNLFAAMGVVQNGWGVYGKSVNGIGVQGTSTGGIGVLGRNRNPTGGIGVHGEGKQVGVMALATGACTPLPCANTYSLLAVGPQYGNGPRYGLYAEGPDEIPGARRYAGNFEGILTLSKNPSFGDPNTLPEFVGRQFFPLQMGTSLVPFVSGRVVGSTATGLGQARRSAYDGANVWFVHPSDGKVSRIRASDGLLLSVTTVSANPQDIAFDGGNMWVVHSGGVLTKLDLKGNVLPPTYATAANADALAIVTVAGTRTIWVAGQNVVSKHTLTAPESPTNYSIGTDLNDVAFDGAYLWFSDGPANVVRQVNPANGSLVSSVSVGQLPRRLLYDGTFLWVANESTNTLSKIRTTTAVNLGSYATSGQARELAFDGTFLWAYAFDTLTSVSSLTRYPAADLVDANHPAVTVSNGTALAMSFDGTYLWVDNAGTVQKFLTGTGWGQVDTGSLVRLQSTTPGVVESGHTNIGGSAIVGVLNATGDLSVSGNQWAGASDTNATQTVSGSQTTHACPAGLFVKGVTLDAVGSPTSVGCRGL